MTVMNPPVLFTDTAGWAIPYLSAFLAASGQTYATALKVRSQKPGDDTPTSRTVTVRDDGGSESESVVKTVTLGVNVWDPDEATCADLSLLVAYAFRVSPGNGPVIAYGGASGPYAVPESGGTHHRYLSVDLVVHGVSL